jgi:hypothetical protein
LHEILGAISEEQYNKLQVCALIYHNSLTGWWEILQLREEDDGRK